MSQKYGLTSPDDRQTPRGASNSFIVGESKILLLRNYTVGVRLNLNGTHLHHIVSPKFHRKEGASPPHHPSLRRCLRHDGVVLGCADGSGNRDCHSDGADDAPAGPGTHDAYETHLATILPVEGFS